MQQVVQLNTNELRKLRQLLRTVPCNGIQTLIPGEGVTFSDTECCNIKSVNSIAGGGATNGLSKVGGNTLLGGTLIQDTAIDTGNYNTQFNNLGSFALLSGGSSPISNGIFQSINTLNNFGNSYGYSTNFLSTTSNLNNYFLINGTALQSLGSNHVINLYSNFTVGNGSFLGTSQSYFKLDTFGGNWLLTQSQSTTLRVIANTRINTNLTSSGIYSTTVSHFANLELITMTGVPTINTFSNFYQLLIRDSRGTGGNQATALQMPNSYGIYQEGVNDKNIFFGPVQNAGGATQFTSDARIKENVVDFNIGLAEIEQINTKKFNYTYNKDREVVGVIAQELEIIIPSAVSLGTFTTPEGENFTDFRMVDQNILFYGMLNAIKELSAKVKELEAKVSGQ